MMAGLSEQQIVCLGAMRVIHLITWLLQQTPNMGMKQNNA